MSPIALYSPPRRHPRFPVQLTVVCVLDNRRRCDRVVDLSEEGARVETPAPLDCGTHSHFYFIIPEGLSGGMLVDVSATVAWVRDSAMGLHFDHRFSAIADYVSRLATQRSMR